MVTGASSGIGRESARVLARDGADVALAARREERLREVSDELESEFGVSTAVVPTDVTEPDSVENLVAETVDAFGGLDIVVANAGIGTGDEPPVEEMPLDQYRGMMSVNTDGMFFTARSALPHLKESDGVLVLLGSFAGNFPRPGSPVYAATKWWTRGFAQSLAGQAGADDVAVTVVNPSEVRTEFGDEYGEASEEAFDPEDVSEPEDVAEAIGMAARQEPPNSLTEIDLYRRDKFTGL